MCKKLQRGMKYKNPTLLRKQQGGVWKWMAHRPSLPHGNRAVPSALECFTTRFGMGRGGSTPLIARQWFRADKTSRQEHYSTSSIHRSSFREALSHAHSSPPHVAMRPARAAYPSNLLGALPDIFSEYTHLGGYFPLRCFQRFLRPDVATEPAGRPTIPPPAVCPIRSSRTKISSPQCTNRS